MNHYYSITGAWQLAVILIHRVESGYHSGRIPGVSFEFIDAGVYSVFTKDETLGDNEPMIKPYEHLYLFTSLCSLVTIQI